MLLLLVECYYCLWNVTIACGKFTIACGMLLLLVECYYCLWNVTIACGMLLLLVECYLASSMCGMQLARFARTGLLASLALACCWSKKIYENLRKPTNNSTNIYENRRKSTKIYENLRTSTKIYETLGKSTKIYENLRKSTKT